jgi:hypothetical protein
MNMFASPWRGQQWMLIASATAVLGLVAVSALSQSSQDLPKPGFDEGLILESDRVADCAAVAPEDQRWHQMRVRAGSGAEQRYPIGSASVAVEVDAPSENVRWTSGQAIEAVIIEGSKASKVRRFEPERFDAAHHTGAIGELRALTFCYTLELSVNVDANAAYTRTHEWTISETAQPARLKLAPGARGKATYRLTVNKKHARKTGWRARGTVTIDNLTPMDATIEAVTMTSDTARSTRVDCGIEPSGYALPAGESLTCSYVSTFSDSSPQQVSAHVTARGDVRGSSASTRVHFQDARVEEIADSVAVTDSRGQQWVFDESSSSVYQRTFECDRDAGMNSSTARIVGSNKDTTTTVVVDCRVGPEESTTARQKEHITD